MVGARCVVLLSAFTIAVVLCGAAGCKRKRPPPRQLPKSGDAFVYLAWTSPEKKAMQLFGASVSAPDGGASHPVCAEPFGGEVRDLKLSPDGTRIVYVAGKQLVVAKTDCTERRVIHEVESREGFENPTWSRDSKTIAYIKHDAAQVHGDVGDAPQNRLMVAATDGARPRDLGTIGSASGPAFSPDGKTLVYAATPDLDFFAGVDQKFELVAIGVDGSRRRALVTANRPLGFPDVSIEGQVVYVAQKGPERQYGDHHDMLMTIDLDGSGKTTVLDGSRDPTFAGSPQVSFQRPRFSPDGARIVFEKGRDIFVVTLEGKIEQRMPGDCAVYSRDGRFLAVWAGNTAPQGGPMQIVSGVGAPTTLIGAAASCASFAP